MYKDLIDLLCIPFATLTAVGRSNTLFAGKGTHFESLQVPLKLFLSLLLITQTLAFVPYHFITQFRHSEC